MEASVLQKLTHNYIENRKTRIPHFLERAPPPWDSDSSTSPPRIKHPLPLMLVTLSPYGFGYPRPYEDRLTNMNKKSDQEKTKQKDYFNYRISSKRAAGNLAIGNILHCKSKWLKVPVISSILLLILHRGGCRDVSAGGGGGGGSKAASAAEKISWGSGGRCKPPGGGVQNFWF